METPKYGRLIMRVIDDEDMEMFRAAGLEYDEKRNCYYSYLTEAQVNHQMCFPDSRWKCPVTREIGDWDDYYYESIHFGVDKEAL